MAKQKKQKKAGLVKRKQNKLNKKRSQKKKILAQKKPAPKQLSMSKVKKNLKNLPTLIFEPELQEILFTGEEITQVRAQSEKLPEQIEALATETFQNKLVEKFELLKDRFEIAGDTNRGMMVNAMLYFMEQENSLPFMNQIIVGMYLVAANQLDQPGSELTLDQLNLQLKEYDKNWAGYLEERTEALEPMMTPEQAAENALPEDEDDELLSSPFESLVEDFESYVSDELSMNADDMERSVEDVEVLLNDYCEEKSITQLDGLSPRKIKNFLEAWFIRKMHPTEDDLATMIQSMTTFAEFLKMKEKLPVETCEEIYTHLQQKDAIMAHLTS